MGSKSTGEQLVQQFRQQHEESNSIITDADEAWLHQVAANVELPPRLPPRRSVISDAGDEIEELALVPYEPPSAEEEGVNEPSLLSPEDAKKTDRAPSDQKKRKYHYWQYIPAIYIGTKAYEQVPAIKEKWAARKAARAEKAKTGSRPVTPDDSPLAEPGQADIDPEEAAKEKKDFNKILEKLDLSAVNDKIIGASKDSQKLMEAFTQVLKDIINGVPTAYDDLEGLITKREDQLDKLFGSLPPFLQTLVKSLPEKLFEVLGPEVAAAAAKTGGGRDDEEASGKKKKKKGAASYIPSLKSLLMERAAVGAMLRAILNFLRLRFPAVLAPNALISLAVFLLLFVFWYCHKRGKEERLKKEGLSRQGSTEVSQEDSSDEDEPSGKVIKAR